jgi:hypothetical protein
VQRICLPVLSLLSAASRVLGSILLLCKMEKFFPLGVFNPMQHLLIHLSYEAEVGGPVQYRWMYHIERALKYLKPMIGNRETVEGCITETFMLKEVAYFSSV